MCDPKVVLPTTTKEWQRDMNIAYQQGRADVIDSVIELFERQNVYDFNCEDCPIYGNCDRNCEEGAYKWFKREVEKLKEQK